MKGIEFFFMGGGGGKEIEGHAELGYLAVC